MVLDFHHTGIVVQDLESMVRFYTDDLGLEELRRMESVAPAGGDHTGVPGAVRTLVFVGLKHGHQIELVHYHHPAARAGYLDKHQLGAAHVCFRVEDIEGLYRELSAHGVRFVTQPKFKQVDGVTVGIVYAQDPEGNWLEFLQGI